jgi:hypothetical protein
MGDENRGDFEKYPQKMAQNKARSGGTKYLEEMHGDIHGENLAGGYDTFMAELARKNVG